MTETLAAGLQYASAIAIANRGVLLLGASGSGKSDLALRLIDRGAVLVCDDGIIIEAADPFPLLRVAPNIAGMIEMRGIGIIKLPFADAVPLHLAVKLGNQGERMPIEEQFINIAGSDIRVITLSAFEASAPLKVEQGLRF